MKLEWKYDSTGEWIAESKKRPKKHYVVLVQGSGKFDVSCSDGHLTKDQSLPKHFDTLGLAQAWCQDCEDHLD